MKRSYKKIAEKARENEGVKIEVSQEILNALVEGEEVIEEIIGRIGLIFVRAIMNSEVEEKTGPKNKRQPGRLCTRWAGQSGFIRLFGKKVRIDKPRVRSKDGRTEIPLTSYKKLQDSCYDEDITYKRMIRGISTRDYEGTMDMFCDGHGIDKSSVSRKFVRASEKKLRALLERDLSEKKYVVIGIDGISFGRDYTAIVAVGINIKGVKEILGIWLGSTENSEVCKSLLNDLISRGLSTDRNYLFVIDGSKGLRKGIRSLFGDKSPIQRCQQHKLENVKSHLPEKYKTYAANRMKAAYKMKDYEAAREALLNTVRYLKDINPSAAASLEEGLEETLTVHKLCVGDHLRRSISTTNFVESAFSIARHGMRNVKRWRNGSHILRWSASAILEAEKRFRRIRGYKELAVLDAAINEKILDNKALRA